MVMPCWIWPNPLRICVRCLKRCLKHVPEPVGDSDAPLQLQIAALDYSSFVGRIGVGRVTRGRIKPGQDVMVMAGDSR